MKDQVINKVIHFLAGELDSDDAARVKKWIKENPDSFEELKRAYESRLFDGISFDRNKAYARIVQQPHLTTSPKKHATRSLYSLSRFWIRVAAVFLGFIAIGLAVKIYYNIHTIQTFSNCTGKIAEYQLPDGSVIFLDKNAEVSYRMNWLNQFTRSVDLKGRAYFEIEKDPAHQFVVNSSEIHVTVFGTRFTVSHLAERYQVILNEGKIEVFSDKLDHSFILSEKGQQIIISGKNLVKQNIVDQNLYFSWLEEKLQFRNCSVGDAICFLSDSYNMKIQTKRKDILNKELIGSAPSDDPILILKAIALITNTDIVYDDEILRLQ